MELEPTDHSHSSLNLARRFCMGVILSIWILSPFFLLQQFTLYKPFIIKPLFLDEWISYEPLAIYPYLLLLVPFIWVFFKASHLNFIKLCKSVALVSLISHLSFFFIPTGITTVGRPILDTDAMPMFHYWLDIFQKPRNSLPSLYAAMTTLLLCACWRESALIKISSLLWSVIVLWAALSLKQNYLIGEVAGIALALTIWFFTSTDYKGKDSDRK